MNKKMIGVTDGRLFENYANWISRDGDVEIVRLGYKYNNLEDLHRCHGLFLTGGEDVHPIRYGKPAYVEEFSLSDFDEQRDEFEIQLLSLWQTSKLPLLGICRGLQLLNIYLGGTLLPDLPSAGKFNHGRKLTEPRYHGIHLDRNSQLYGVINTASGDVTSIHHQSIDRIARKLVSNAITQDGVIEGAEWLNPKDKTPVVLIQWHPEVMQDQSSPFAKNVREYFLNLVKDKLYV